MKKLLVITAVLIPVCANAGIYTNTGNFRPYIGIDAGLNVADYSIQTDLDDVFYSAKLNAGIRVGKNFGAGVFFTHSSSNKLEHTITQGVVNHEIYYMSFGFDIFGYYNITKELDFFTTFGVANNKIYNKYTFINQTDEYSEQTSQNDVGTRLGIGLMYNFPGDNVSALFQYQYVPVNNDLIGTMSEFSAGFRYTF